MFQWREDSIHAVNIIIDSRARFIPQRTLNTPVNMFHIRVQLMTDAAHPRLRESSSHRRGGSSKNAGHCRCKVRNEGVALHHGIKAETKCGKRIFIKARAKFLCSLIFFMPHYENYPRSHFRFRRRKEWRWWRMFNKVKYKVVVLSFIGIQLQSITTYSSTEQSYAW